MTDTPTWGDSAPIESPPAAPEAEREIVAAVLCKGSLIHQLTDVLEPSHFSEEAFGMIWAVFLRFAEREMEITATLLLEPLMSETGWNRVDVLKALAGLMTTVMKPTASQVLHYAKAIKDAWARRRLWEVAKDLKQRSALQSLDESPAQLLDETESELSRITEERGAQEHSFTFAQAIAAGLEQAQAAASLHEQGKLVGVTSGIGTLDRKLGGWRQSDLIVVGARASMGKSSFAVRAISSAAEQCLLEKPDDPEWVAFFSLEMGADQLALRRLAAEAGVSFEKIRLGSVDTQDLMALERAGVTLSALPILIDDNASITVGQIRARARRLQRRKGLRLIIIDYLQLIGLSRQQRKECGGNRVQEVSLITRDLKAMAKDLGVPVIALCQLSREVEKREDKRPQLSDLRESGTIEQDADLVCFLYRPAYYLAQRPPVKGAREKEIDYNLKRAEWATDLEKAKDVAEFIIAKNRHGSLGMIPLKFLAELMRFEDDTPGDATMGGERKQQLRMDLAALD